MIIFFTDLSYFSCQKASSYTFKELGQSLHDSRQDVLELMSSDDGDPARESHLSTAGQQAVDLTRQFTDVSSRLKLIDTGRISEGDVSEAFLSVETFWEDLFPLKGNRLARLLVETVEIRETGIDMELRTNGLAGLVGELTSLACEAGERGS